MQYIIGGLAIGSVYALVAVGYSMIWAALGFLNFAQGYVVMFGGFIGLAAWRVLGRYLGGVPLVLAVFVITAVTMAGLAVLIQTAVHRPVIRRSSPSFLRVNMLITTLSLGIILENVARIVWLTEPIFFPLFPRGLVKFWGLSVPGLYVWMLIATGVMVLLLQALLYYTRVGLAMRAVAQDRQVAAMMGIDVQRSIYSTFCVAYVTGAVAGLLVGPLLYVAFNSGLFYGLQGFAAAVLGGIGNVPAAIAGGLLLGVLENLGAGLLHAGYRSAIAFFVVIVILLVKPAGLLGTTPMEKV
ncbi:MAG: branched-chain amino acid ABC transporter permease [bacterium]|nr:branched-chain amino acid ABC transporter permease [bacterium]